MTLTPARILPTEGGRLQPSAAELIERAEALVPALVAAQQQTEQQGQYSAELHQQLSAAGFFRILVPRRYGGYQLGADTFFRVTMVLARGCPSTAWMYSRSAIHALTVASLFSEQAQSELFGSGEFVAPATMVPGGSAEPSGGNGWRLNGTWASCAGTPFATHFIGHLMVETPTNRALRPLMFVAPRSEWRQVEDAGAQLGLRGSGSHGIAVNGRVPAYFALLGTELAGAGDRSDSPGRALHGSSEYGRSAFSYLSLERASLAVGIARGALDAYTELMRTRKTLVPPIIDRSLDADYQYWYGEAIGLIATAESALYHSIGQLSTGPELTGEGGRAADLRLAAVCRQVTRLCWHSLEHYLFPTAGASAARAGGRLERLWRDMSMVHSQSGFAMSMSTIASRDLAKTSLGLH